MLGSADETAYDLRFRVLDVPVRVNPWFWLVMLMISGQSENLLGAAAFVSCAFLSILVHEFGHGLSSRAFGNEPTGIVLYGMGGYCSFGSWHRRAWERIVVLLCGPGAGFLLFALVLTGASSAYHLSPYDLVSLIGIGHGEVGAVAERIGLYDQNPAGFGVIFLLEINFWWGVLNLIPIWPLDGGQITQVALSAVNPRSGARWAHVVSLLTAGLIAFWFASQERYMMALWFGYFGFLNYQVLQSFHDKYRFRSEW